MRTGPGPGTWRDLGAITAYCRVRYPDYRNGDRSGDNRPGRRVGSCGRRRHVRSSHRRDVPARLDRRRRTWRSARCDCFAHSNDCPGHDRQHPEPTDDEHTGGRASPVRASLLRASLVLASLVLAPVGTHQGDGDPDAPAQSATIMVSLPMPLTLGARRGEPGAESRFGGDKST